MSDVVIVDAVRSPLGRGERGGALAGTRPDDLLAHTVNALLDRCGVDPGLVDEVLVSCTAELDPAASSHNRLSPATPVWTADTPAQRVIHRGVRRSRVTNGMVVVCGVELMSGHGQAGDVPDTATPSRWDQYRLDRYAAGSRERAQEVSAMGEFEPEIIPIHLRDGLIATDETVLDGSDGYRFTAADGASAMLITTTKRAADLGLRSRARFVALADRVGNGTDVSVNAIAATRTVLDRIGLRPDDFDHYEISETSAVIPLAWQEEFHADTARLNPRGGAIGLGHPIGASAIRSVTTMIGALDATGGRWGLQVMEGAGGTADAMAIERLVPHRLPQRVS